MGEAKDVRIYITDDHGVVRQGLRGIIDDTPGLAVCGEADDGRKALNWLSQNSNCCDVVLLDLSMPGMDGLELLKELKRIRPDLAVLVLTMHNDDQYAIRVIRSGAMGYLSKECSGDEIIEAIFTVASGNMYINDILSGIMSKMLDSKSVEARHQLLSDREFQVMKKLARGDKVTDIARELALSPKTISTYRTRIMEKMKFDTHADVFRYASIHRLLD
ncbi:MAG: response regulator transcription factor [Proteobacteria bacterium]|nr:response regulator transcription factor [Pseudomonadota bacterium]MBU1686006.1 response regulator transcription factor [Pseudomonadota bacterium]